MLYALASICAAHGQDSRKVPISFLPPPLETATYSLGIYDAKSGKLVRRLQEAATESAFTVGLNGLITELGRQGRRWQSRAAGAYAARGYAVGALKVEGVEILGNDWADDDENLRPKALRAIAITPADDGLAVLGIGHNDRCSRARATKGRVVNCCGKTLPRSSAAAESHQCTRCGHGCYHGRRRRREHRPTGWRTARRSSRRPVRHGRRIMRQATGGKDGTIWKIEEGVLAQYSAQGERLRSLAPKEGDPIPLMVAASKDQDRLYLLEATKGWQRVRGLSWVETKEENGKPVSTWQTFFERNIHPRGPVSWAATPPPRRWRSLWWKIRSTPASRRRSKLARVVSMTRAAI